MKCNHMQLFIMCNCCFFFFGTCVAAAHNKILLVFSLPKSCKKYNQRNLFNRHLNRLSVMRFRIARVLKPLFKTLILTSTIAHGLKNKINTAVLLQMKHSLCCDDVIVEMYNYIKQKTTVEKLHQTSTTISHNEY